MNIIDRKLILQKGFLAYFSSFSLHFSFITKSNEASYKEAPITRNSHNTTAEKGPKQSNCRSARGSEAPGPVLGLSTESNLF